MSEAARQEVTGLLEEIRAGDETAKERLFQLVYQQLHNQAKRSMAKERGEHTLQTTALVNEAVIQLLEQEVLAKASNRRYFFGAAGRAMRQILVRHARERGAKKRGEGWVRTPFDELVDAYEQNDVDIEALDKALHELARLDARQHEIITLHFFGGRMLKEIGEMIELPPQRVSDLFATAKAFLYGQLDGEEHEPRP